MGGVGESGVTGSCFKNDPPRHFFVSASSSDDASTLDDLREAATTLEDTARTARRVLGGAHPLTVDIEHGLRLLREALEHLRDAVLGTS